MKESHEKELANHLGSESCEAVRKGRREVLTGENAGELLSREITTPDVPTLLSEAEGNIPAAGMARQAGTRRGRRAVTEAGSARAGANFGIEASGAAGGVWAHVDECGGVCGLCWGEVHDLRNLVDEGEEERQGPA